MQKAGIRHMNKKRGQDRTSYFADHWREYIGDKGLIAAAKQKTARRRARARESRRVEATE
jgi:hypothetical protein